MQPQTFDSSWSRFFDWLMSAEGRMVHVSPNDPGGQTAWGIARKKHPEWEGWKLVDSGDTQSSEFLVCVETFYKTLLQKTWTLFPSGVREIHADCVVNCGETATNKVLQKSLNSLARTSYVTVDGILGKQTLEAVRYAEKSGLCASFLFQRALYYNSLTRKNVSLRAFLGGWLNRLASLEEFLWTIN